MTRTRILAFAAGLAITAVLAGTSGAQAADATPTTTVVSVNGYTSDVTLQLKDGQYPADHAPAALAASVTWASPTGAKPASGPVTFYRNGDVVGNTKLTGCSTSFQAKYAGQDAKPAVLNKAGQIVTPAQKAFAPSWSQIVTVTLTGGHCATTTPTPSTSTTAPAPTPTVTKTVAIPAPAQTVVQVVTVPEKPVAAPATGNGSPSFTG